MKNVSPLKLLGLNQPYYQRVKDDGIHHLFKEVLPNKPIIQWTKWEDPLDVKHDTNDEELTPWEKGELKTYGIGNNPQDKNHNLGFLNTPVGIIPLKESTLPGRVFNFWDAHTNFSITKNMARVINTTSGVETIQFFSRYRFRISIGKLFVNDAKVRSSIDERLCFIINQKRGNQPCLHNQESTHKN